MVQQVAICIGTQDGAAGFVEAVGVPFVRVGAGAAVVGKEAVEGEVHRQFLMGLELGE